MDPRCQPGQATALWANSKDATFALGLLSDEQRAKITKFYHIRDAKLSLRSSLLKRAAIAQDCQVPWSDARIGQDNNRKPCYHPPHPQGKKLQFNISHHGTIVVLAGCLGEETQVGIDVVSMHWEKDIAMVLKEGFVA